MSPKKIDPETGLTPRQRNLLFAVVKEYCEFGATVSSQDLKQKYDFNISPATIRNEFIELRNLGFLYQPFTNSSSQPTEKSFKLFINQLIIGLQVTNKHQQELRGQLQELQLRQEGMEREISRLLAMETNSVGFAVTVDTQTVMGLKNLLTEGQTDQTANILDFLENIDENKKYFLEQGNQVNKNPKNKYSEISAIFGMDNPVLPLGKGYALVSTKARINNQDTVFGVITQPHILGRKKTLQILKTLKQVLEEDN